MVATDKQIQDVIERSGLLDVLASGAVICIASSCSPETCRESAKLAAPKRHRHRSTCRWCWARRPTTTARSSPMCGGEDASVRQGAAGARGLQRAGAACRRRAAPARSPRPSTTCCCGRAWWPTTKCLTFAKKLGVDVPRLIEALGHGSGANWSLSRWGKSTGKWAEKDMDVALELAQEAKMPVPLAGLVDQLMKQINQERMKALLS